MRDTAIGILMVLAVAGVYRYLARHGGFPSDGSVSALARAGSHPSSSRAHSTKRLAHKDPAGRRLHQTALPATVVSAFRPSDKAETHVPRSDRNAGATASSPGQDEGAAGDLAEAQGLTSIYEEAKPEPGKGVGNAPTTDKKVLYGVPVAAYLASHRNRVNVPLVVQSDKPAMRVFLQCMELKKKGLDPLTEHGCKELLGGSNPGKLEHPGEMHPWFPNAIGG